MKLAALALLVAPLAHADVALEEYGAVAQRPAQQISETACEVDVHLHGAVVTVEQRQRLANAGGAARDLAASYTFDLPVGAAITGFALRVGSAAEEKALPVSSYETVDLVRRPMLAADPALLVALPDGGYAIRVQPFARGSELTLITRYTALADIAGGALRFTLPARTGRGALAVCTGTVKVTPGAGTSVARISIAGASTTARPAPFTLGDKPLLVEAQLAFAGTKPVLWTQSQPLGDGTTAHVVTVAAPSLRTQTPLHRRALFVIDSSRSMELVGRPNVNRVIRAVTAALPANIEVDAVLYDRTAKRVFTGWQSLTAETGTAIDKALAARPAVNGSDLPAALAVAHGAITDGTPASTLVVVISDGVLGGATGKQLIEALDGKTSTVDVLAIVVDPARTAAPSATALRAPVSLYGGSFVEVAADELDSALPLVDEWLRPAWLDVSLGTLDVPATVRSGGGFVRTAITRSAVPKLVARGLSLAARPGPAVSVGALVLANTPDAVPSDKFPYVTDQLAFAVLTSVGKSARSRTAMVRGGGPYERIVAERDPDAGLPVAAKPAAQPSAIARMTLERMFRDQLQPKAFACYQRALGQAPSLAGTVHFTLHLGRGEITDVQLAGLGNAQLDRCLLDAAYQLNVPMPDFAVNADDQTIAHYPLTFSLHADAPVIVLGDADSASPLDIDAIQGGVPASARSRTAPIKVDAQTPLGTMRPSN